MDRWAFPTQLIEGTVAITDDGFRKGLMSKISQALNCRLSDGRNSA